MQTQTRIKRQNKYNSGQELELKTKLDDKRANKKTDKATTTAKADGSKKSEIG